MKKLQFFLPFLFFVFVQNLFAQNPDWASMVTSLTQDVNSPNFEICSSRNITFQVCNRTNQYPCGEVGSGPNTNSACPNIEIKKFIVYIEADVPNSFAQIESFAHSYSFGNLGVGNKNETTHSIMPTSKLEISHTYFPLKEQQNYVAFPYDDDGYNGSETPCVDHLFTLKRITTKPFTLTVSLKVDIQYILYNDDWSQVLNPNASATYYTVETIDYQTAPLTNFNNVGIVPINGVHKPVNISTQYNITKSAPNGTPLLIPSVADKTPQKVRIEGTLWIDKDYTFFGDPNNESEIIMGSDAKIVVRPGATLTLKHTKIHGCSEMWDKIEVQVANSGPGGRLNIINSEIEDAHFAVYSYGYVNGSNSTTNSTRNPMVSIRGSKFTNNYVSIWAKGRYNNIFVQRNTFTSRNIMLKAPYDTDILPDGSKNEDIVRDLPFTGVLITNNGRYSDEESIYSKMANGIFCKEESSRIFCKYSMFYDLGMPYIYHDGDTPASIAKTHYGTNKNGFGIYFECSEANISHLQVDNCQFSGIYGPRNRFPDFYEGTAIAIAGGVSCNINNSQAYSIAHYSVAAYNIASISVLHSDFNNVHVTASNPNELKFIENSIGYLQIRNSQMENTKGIVARNYIGYLQMKNVTGKGGVDVIDNTGVSFELVACDTIKVRRNYLESLADLYDADNSCYYGGQTVLTSVLCKDCSIDCNTFKTTQGCSIEPVSDVIITENNHTTIYQNKIIADSYQGVSFIGEHTLMSNYFAKNDFLDGYPTIAVEVQFDGVVGEQIHTENLIGNFSKVANYNPVTPKLNLIANSRFFVDSKKDVNFLPSIISPISWFTDEVSDVPKFDYCNGIKPPNYCYSWGRVDSLMVSENYGSSHYDEEMTWRSRSRIYDYISRHRQCIEGNEFFDDFYRKNNETSIGLHSRVLDIKNTLGSYNLAANETPTFIRESINTLSNEITDIEKAALLNETDKNTLILLAQKDNRIKQIELLEAKLTAFNKNEALERAKNIKKALEINNKIDENKALLPDIFQKEIDDILLNTIYQSNDKFDEKQWQNIDKISHYCPFLGGDAVYVARGLYSTRFPKEKFDDKKLCNFKVITKQANIQTDMKISPNPSSDFVKITFNLQDIERITLSDLSGKLLINTDIPFESKEVQIETNKLENGLYIVSLVSKGKIVDSQKLIIIK